MSEPPIPKRQRMDMQQIFIDLMSLSQLALPSSSQSDSIHMVGKNFAFSTDLHFVAPAILRFPSANGPVDKPAEMPYFEFPCRTNLASLRRTVLNLPAGANLFNACF